MTQALQTSPPATPENLVDSSAAWLRLGAAFCMSTIGTAGMWLPPVVLPTLQEEFGASRSGASLPYTATMVGVAVGTLMMGRLVDRVGIFRLLLAAALSTGAGFAIAGSATTLWQFSLAQGTFIAMLGVAVTFAPLVADLSLWFKRYRGMAVAICASGNYMAGMLWPPIVQQLNEAFGWRSTYLGIAVASVAVMLPLAFLFRRPPPLHEEPPPAVAGSPDDHARPLGFPPNVLQVLIVLAGISCCIAMSMPQVHIVAYCADLGYGAARGAEMLSVMLGLGLVSRLASGWIADRIGALATLILGSGLQAVALALFLPFNGLASLYVISGLFGLVQGGIVPCYALLVREYFPAREAGVRIGFAITSTLVGMALGGWLTGVIFDLTGSYRAAFVHGIAWNGLNLAIAGWLLLRSRAMGGLAFSLPRR